MATANGVAAGFVLFDEANPRQGSVIHRHHTSQDFHQFLSPNDEFADYEAWSQGNLDRSQTIRRWLDARVIEIPTPRWTAYEAVHFGIDMLGGFR